MLINRIITSQWEGMGDVGSARYQTIRVLNYSNCQRSTHSFSIKVNFQKFSTLGLSYVNELQLNLFYDTFDRQNRGVVNRIDGCDLCSQ